MPPSCGSLRVSWSCVGQRVVDRVSRRRSDYGDPLVPGVLTIRLVTVSVQIGPTEIEVPVGVRVSGSEPHSGVGVH